MMLRFLSLFVLAAIAATSALASSGIPYMSPVYHTSSYSYMAITKVELNGFTKSSGYSGTLRYNNYTTQAGPSVELNNSYDVSITRGSYSGVFRHCFIDWNNDGDFADANEEILRQTVRDTATVVTTNFDVPAGTAPGFKRMRIRLTYSYTSSPQWNQNTSYGETEDYCIEVIAPPAPVVTSAAIPGTYEGVPYEKVITAVDGTPPYTYSLVKHSNADWVNIDDATGKVFGTPPENSGGTNASFDVVATDINTLSGQATFSVEVKDPQSLPFMENMDSGTGNFVLQTGEKSLASNITIGGSSGPALVGSAIASASWALSPGDSNLSVLDNPSVWEGGGSPDSKDWSGQALFAVASSDTKRLAVEFDYSIFNSSTQNDKDYFANFVVEYTENNKDWLRAEGENDNALGFYRDATTGFAHEVAYLSLSGTQSQVAIRIKWLVRNHYNGAEATYVAIDNLSTYIPVHFLGETSLPSGQETVPLTPYVFETLGGASPVSIEFDAQNPVDPDLNLSISESNGVWSLQTPPNLGPAIGTIGVHQISITAIDALDRRFTQVFTLSIALAPAQLRIETEALPSTTGMTNYSKEIVVSGGVPFLMGGDYRYSLVNSSASWISVDASTGVVSGMVPEADIGVTHQVTVSVIDRVDTVRQITFDLVITEHMMLAESAFPNAMESFTYRHGLEMMGGTAPYTWLYVGGSKPVGLNLNPTTGALEGVPYLGQTGSFSFDVKVSDSGTQEITATLDIAVEAKTISTLAITTEASSFKNPAVNEPFDMAFDAGGGVPPYSWSLVSASLPSGLNLSTDGKIGGSAVPGTNGRYSIKVRVFDALGDTFVQNFSFDIAPEYFEPVIEMDTDLGVIGEGTALVILLDVKKGKPPFTWSIIDGALPSGFGLNTVGGSLFGTPQADTGSALGTVYTFTLGVTDSENVTAQETFTLAVTKDPSKQFQVDTTNELPASELGAGHYSALLTVTNGTPPFTWTLVDGALPDGIKLGSFGGLYGSTTTAQTGQYDFTVEARDSIGNVTQQQLSMIVVPSGATDEGSLEDSIDPLAALPTSNGQGSCALDSSSDWAFLLLALLAFSLVVGRKTRLS